jgi:hypothetical protein
MELWMEQEEEDDQLVIFPFLVSENTSVAMGLFSLQFQFEETQILWSRRKMRV